MKQEGRKDSTKSTKRYPLRNCARQNMGVGMRGRAQRRTRRFLDTSVAQPTEHAHVLHSCRFGI
eukprot:3284827-Pleurochrysis_carterae.AAC.1